MSYIVGGGGGLTEDEIKTLIGGIEPKLLDASDRNGETATAVAGIYNPCKTILNEHRPVCTKEYHLVGKHLDGAENPDVWFTITGGNGSVVYANRYLTITGSTNGTVAANRAVIDQTKFPITGNFAEVTCRIGSLVNGSGGLPRIAIGFQSAFSSYQPNETACFLLSAGQWRVIYAGGYRQLNSLSLGRNLISGDVVTVRLDRQEGSANIDIVRFYVNGQKQYETLNIPEVDCYAGIGVFSDANTTTAARIAIDYFGVRYVP